MTRILRVTESPLHASLITFSGIVIVTTIYYKFGVYTIGYLGLQSLRMCGSQQVVKALTTTKTLLEAGVFGFPRWAKPSAAA